MAADLIQRTLRRFIWHSGCLPLLVQAVRHPRTVARSVRVYFSAMPFIGVVVLVLAGAFVGLHVTAIPKR